MLALYESFPETSFIKSSESGDKGSLLNAASPLLPPSGSGTAGPQQIAFVDSGLDHIDDLIASLSAATVYTIGAGQNGAQYISEILSQYGREDISGVHIFSHGQAGGLQLGNMSLNVDTLTGYENELAEWGESVSGDILFYGCEVAQGETGQGFLEQLAALSGGDIQASDDLTGNALFGGDWVLETSLGEIETELAIAVADQQAYQGVFRSTTSNGGGDKATINQQQLLVQENTTLVKPLPRLDGAGVPFRYTLSGPDAGQFKIATNGELRFKNAPDYEKPSSATRSNVYNLTVASADSAGVSNSQSLAVSVTNQVSVYLLGGQSNMSGVGSSGSDLTGAYASPLPEVRIWKNGSYVALKNGFSKNDGKGTGFGAEIGFGFALEAARKNGTAKTEEIYLVKNALGSTSLEVDWNINGNNNQYDKFTASVDSALANLRKAGLGYKVEAMLWMQGESDADIATRANNYASNLTNLIGDVRSRYGSATDFVIGRLHEELDPVRYLYDDIVRNAQTSVANADPRNRWINTDRLAVGADSKHFTSAGHLALGTAFANVVKTIL
jgi:Domain of unknown function (DUF4347)/Carbohydrate esterase, sialic acid-specific acetylesterase